MTLKDITKDLHQQAESTQFMRALFDGKLHPEVWIDFTYQKTLFYNTIEGAAGSCRLLHDLPDIRRGFKIYQDYCAMISNSSTKYHYRSSVVDYHNYILSINKDPDLIMAHLYVWHMGDLYGGQMIKRMVQGSHIALDFENKELLIQNIRAKLNAETMGQEARRAFEWSIKILKEYDNIARPEHQ